MKTPTPATIRLDTAGQKQEISPTLYGVFFEDINFGGDGGLYGELLKNPSFEFFSLDGSADKRFQGWETFGSGVEATVETAGPVSLSHPNYLRLTFQAQGTGGVRNLGCQNEGFAVGAGEPYRFSVWARASVPVALRVAVQTPAGQAVGETAVTVSAPDWLRYEVTFPVSASVDDAVFTLGLEGPGTIDLDLVSLFPVNTFGGRVNGLRADLVQLLKDLKPSFLRFPGGCIVEGRSFDSMYRWKETIGDLKDRRTNWNRWQLDEYQRPGASSADYFQSNGLGFYEYFLLCEDIGAQAVPVLNCGMTCQWHEGLLVPLDELDPFIQDALDLVEFANGGPDTVWGRKRCELGHPAPFGLKRLGIGNEQWNQVYFERYEAFHRVLKARHPEIELITSSGPGVDDEYFHRAQKWMAETDCRADLVDEHYYRSPEWFLENVRRYDGYDRKLPKIFLGEYASHTAGKVEDRQNNWKAALSEAALLTGVEQNADHVVMACYAPLFAKTGHHQWGPNLIWFNNADAYGTPSYHVQKLYSTNLGRWMVRAQAEGSALLVAASLTEDGDEVILKVVNLAPEAVDSALAWEGPGTLTGRGSVQVLACGDPETVNSHTEPRKIAPREAMLKASPPTYRFEGSSLTVMRLGLTR